MKTAPKLTFIILLLVSALIVGACSSAAPESTPDTSAEEEVDQADSFLVTSLTDAKGAVIQIAAQGTFVDPEFGEYSGAGFGSGFIIDQSGLALTNNHVVTGAALLEVWVGGDTSKTYNAQILGVSECSDLALIDIEGDGFPYLEWYPDPITVGLEIYTAGYPLGDPEYTLTRGIISKEKANGESTWASVNHVLEHDATINPGNSGGPIITGDGQVVGVNYASYAAAGQFFAIARDTVLPIIEELRAGNDIDSLGINGLAVVSEDGSLSGIWINSVKSGSAADEAGVEPGDLITSMEGLDLATDGNMSDYCDIIRTQGDENTLAMEVIRFDTNEVLEGQFNGRELAVTGSIEGPDQTSDDIVDLPAVGSSENIIEVFDDGYIGITDDSFSIYVEVPAGWNDIDGSSYSDYWGEDAFEALDVAAAPSLDDFYSYYDAPGISVTLSRDWAAIGDVSMLLDFTQAWFNENCDYMGREDYWDPLYEGVFDTWFCSNAEVILIAVYPIENPSAYLMLLNIQLPPEVDLEVIERIYSTFGSIE
jgi:serine protease Do